MATQWESDSSVPCSCFSTTDLQKQLGFLGERARLSWSEERMLKATSQNWGVCCSCACSSLALCLKRCLCQVQSFTGLCSRAVLACFSLPEEETLLAIWHCDYCSSSFPVPLVESCVFPAFHTLFFIFFFPLLLLILCTDTVNCEKCNRLYFLPFIGSTVKYFHVSLCVFSEA